MSDELKPLDFIDKINEINESLNILTNLNNKNLIEITTIIKDLRAFKISLDKITENHKEGVKQAFVNNLAILNERVHTNITNIDENLIQPNIDKLREKYTLLLPKVEKNLIKELETNLNNLKNEFESMYKTNFDNALNDLKAFNNNLENSKNLSELKELSKQAIKDQKTIIENQININKNFERQLKFFKFKQSFLSILFWLIVGGICGIVSTRFIFIDYFKSYQAEQDAKTIKAQNDLNIQQQEQLNKFNDYKKQLDDLGIYLKFEDNKPYLILTQKNMKSDLVDSNTKGYKIIELTK